MIKWFVVRTKPKNEDRAKRNLENGGFEVLAPKIRYRRLKDGKISEVIEEMFPGYIFVKFLLEKDYRTIKYTRGVKEIVHFGDRIIPVQEEVIHYIRARLKNGVADLEPPKISRGEKVTITDGPFKGLTGIFERELKPKERVSILLEGLTYYAKIVLPREFVASCAEN
jgi:transcriptional antiterminator RfaH